MNQVQWTAVDGYFAEHLLSADPVLDAALRANAAAGLPAIDVSPVQGKFLHLLALSKGARRILEVGTLGGYSTIWLARALPADGRMITLELNPKHAQVARANLEYAGVSQKVEIRVGPAAGSLAQLHNEGAEPLALASRRRHLQAPNRNMTTPATRNIGLCQGPLDAALPRTWAAGGG